jgi:hypothetical protein
MSIISFFKNLIDPTPTHEVQKTSTTNQVAQTQKVKRKDNVPMVREESLNSKKNVDSTEIQDRTSNNRHKIYTKIAKLCVDYRMSMEDVKKAKLLENIAGCSEEELAKKSDAEINECIQALEHTLKYRSWKLPWQDRDIDDINKIAKHARDRLIYTKTSDRGWLGEMFRKSSSLEKELKSAGYSNDEQGVISYFHNMYTELIKSGKSKDEAYAEMLNKFGKLLIDTDDPIQKELLTAGISKLKADNRVVASRLSMTSCGANSKSRQSVARGLSKHYEDISCSADANGEYTSQSDNIEISGISFGNMSEEDVNNALVRMDERKTEIEQKLKNGVPLTKEEEHYQACACSSQYAGALVGSAQNENLTDRNETLRQIDENLEQHGLRDEVYKLADDYLKSNQGSNNTITAQEFKKTMDNATNGAYSKVLSQNSSSNDVETKTSKSDNKKTESNDAEVDNVTAQKSGAKDKRNTKTTLATNNNVSTSTQTKTLRENNTSARRKTSSERLLVDIPTKTKSQTVSSSSATTSEQVVTTGSNPSLDIQKCKTSEDCKDFIKQYGDATFVKETYSNNNADKTTVKIAERYYDNMSASRQELILKGLLSSKAVEKLLANTKSGALKSIENINLSSYNATQEKNKKIEEIKKQKGEDTQDICFA